MEAESTHDARVEEIVGKGMERGIILKRGGIAPYTLETLTAQWGADVLMQPEKVLHHTIYFRKEAVDSEYYPFLNVTEAVMVLSSISSTISGLKTDGIFKTILSYQKPHDKNCPVCTQKVRQLTALLSSFMLWLPLTTTRLSPPMKCL